MKNVPVGPLAGGGVFCSRCWVMWFAANPRRVSAAGKRPGQGPKLCGTPGCAPGRFAGRSAAAPPAKSGKTPGCNPWLCGAASCSAGTPGRLLIKVVYYTFPGLCKGVVKAGPPLGGFSASSPRAAHSSSPIPVSAALLHSQTPCWSPAKRRKG